MAPSREEEEQRRAVDSERKLWETAIFQAAQNAGVATEGRGAGEVLTKMATRINVLRQEVVDLVKQRDG
jgi:hypothetical protein